MNRNRRQRRVPAASRQVVTVHGDGRGSRRSTVVLCTPPDDPTRPEGEAESGGIWLHMGHSSGTSACGSLSESAMECLLRALDPDRHPVVVRGGRADLKGLL